MKEGVLKAARKLEKNGRWVEAGMFGFSGVL